MTDGMKHGVAEACRQAVALALDGLTEAAAARAAIELAVHADQPAELRECLDAALRQFDGAAAKIRAGIAALPADGMAIGQNVPTTYTPWLVVGSIEEGMRIETEGGVVVAYLRRWRDDETTCAHARLIAAAPEMLETLRTVRCDYKAMKTDVMTPVVIALLDDTIGHVLGTAASVPPPAGAVAPDSAAAPVQPEEVR